MRYSCRAVVGHGQKCEPNYQCDACAAKQKYIPRIEKLEAALRAVIDWDNTLVVEDGPFLGDVMNIVRKALEDN